MTTVPSSFESGSFTAVSVIRRRRRNVEDHSAEEIAWFINAFVNDKSLVTDYQMTAWLMAVCCNGLSPTNTAQLTQAVVQSGIQLQWGNKKIDRSYLLADKHSTGGVGDKGSLILAPLVASMGVHVPMLAGRGLGHTGGTIDKLEAIPGMNCQNLTVSQFQTIVQSPVVGCAIAAANDEICPADRRMYALRDVTDTVASIPLQTASIMSKKIAEHPDYLVLDVKCGCGSFQETVDEAQALATSMVSSGHANGIPTVAFLTRMDQPIGRYIGNWLEVIECIEIMKNLKEIMRDERTRDLITLVVTQAAQMVQLAEQQEDATSSSPLQVQYLDRAWDHLIHGKAWNQFREMIMAQGGNIEYIDHPELCNLPRPTVWRAASTGYIASLNARTIGEVSVSLGAGRRVVTDPIDPMAGIVLHAKIGSYVRSGDILADLYHHPSTNQTSSPNIDALLHRLESAVAYSPDPVPIPPIVTHRVTMDGIEPFHFPKDMHNPLWN
jgi:pyrimidine-nucleoside phosphorylase